MEFRYVDYYIMEFRVDEDPHKIIQLKVGLEVDLFFPYDLTFLLAYSYIYTNLIRTHTHTHTHIFLYVIHRQTVSFYQNSSVWLDTQDARSQDRNPSNFTLD